MREVRGLRYPAVPPGTGRVLAVVADAGTTFPIEDALLAAGG